MNHSFFRLIVSVLLGLTVLAACAPLPKDEKKGDNKPIVFPAPPDEPRFVFERTIYGSADVVTRKSENQLKQALTGIGETSEGLGKPYAVAVHHGRVMVTDSADRFVRVFDFPAGRYYKIGDDEAGSLVKPLGIDVDSAGNVYVADATAKTVMVYDLSGKFLRKIGGPKQFDRLSSVTVDPEGKRIYVVDIGGVSSEHHRVRVFDAGSGVHLFDIGKRGTGKGEFNLPRDVALGKDGRIYVVDGGNFRVQVFDATGKYMHAFGTIGKQLGNFARPKEIAADTEGNVYVVDAAFGNFQVFNADGDLLMYAGERSERDGPARYMLPSGVYVDEDGRVYLVDQWFRKVDVYRPATLAADAGYLGKRAVGTSK
jgi:DNA-binding beta-propeller fold protein YncE